MDTERSGFIKNKYRIYIDGIAIYKLGKMTFRELMSYTVPIAYDIAQDFKYKGSVDEFADIVDAWAEMICYAYNGNRELGLKFADFFEKTLLTDNTPISFPVGEPVLDNILKKYQ